jgi:Rhodopirellula transposase DDE domain
MIDERPIRTKYRLLLASFTERTRRLWAAAEVRLAGRGGFAAVVRATGISPTTLAKAGRELDLRRPLPPEWVRRPGGGRKRAEEANPELSRELAQLVEPSTRGDPQSPLRWTCKSTRRLAGELRHQGYAISHVTVARLLMDADYSLQANRKTMEGTTHPDRNAQFEYINARATRQLNSGDPLVSVDTKKKELVGEFKNAGRE